MNVLFLTIVDIDSLEESNIYTDLLRKFWAEGHTVYMISPVERKKNISTHYIKSDERIGILKLRIGNIQKTNIIEKGISTITLEGKFISAVKKYFHDVKFDLVMYSTPPITFGNVIKYIKRRDCAKTYLLLKDIFPQNAVDMGMLSKTGLKGILYRFFRNKEKKLYQVSDYIGCMSQANVDYIISHNAEVNSEIVEICPNSIEVMDKSVSEKERIEIRQKYNIPLDKKVFVYGGNLGKPQGIDFLIECLKRQEMNEDVFFLIVGDGTEYPKIEEYINKSQVQNVRLMKRLPKDDYDLMVGACDVGMIFLDHRFTIPNFPSRMLGYMQAKLPVLAVTDPNSDIGKVIVDGGFGWWCESDDADRVVKCMQSIHSDMLSEAGNNAYEYLVKYYDVRYAYNAILKWFKREKKDDRNWGLRRNNSDKIRTK
ncbi:MAG: glycosyltransferase family 4 protein [Lachnospiraceae bacterium]|nr:glycosyltransferase family 4 protein [Lachnospiraceae bacterium]